MDREKDSPEVERVVRSQDVGAKDVLYVIGFLCLLFMLFLYLGSEPLATVKNTKLFPLFESKKYHQLEKKIDSESRVLLVGDDEDGLGVFIDQYINERDTLLKIKRREYHVGKNLEYANNNIFSRGYNYITKTVSSIFKKPEQE